jgi:hypothetical protein
MAVNYNCGSIVTNGLVLALDAANSKSYPGSGTTWTNLISGGSNGTLLNGVGYSGDNLGSLVFDGVNDYVQLTSDNFYAETIIVWGKSNTPTWSGSGSGAGFEALSSSRRTNGHSFHTNAGNRSISIFVGLSDMDSNFNSYHDAGAVTPDDIQIPHMYVYSTNGLDSHKGYLDSQLVVNSSTTISRDLNTVQRNWQMGRADFPPQARYGNVTIYAVQKYNRQLTDAEIQQNFNAFRGRFSI